MADFKKRLAGQEPLLGTFVKTSAPHNVEILGSVGFDFVVIDREHAPLSSEAVDLLLLASKARRLSALVRVGGLEQIGHALDSGADGIVAPHVSTAAEAADVVAACRHVNGRRGFSSSPRAGDYGRVSLSDHVRMQDATIAVVVMIEDAVAVERAAEIVEVPGVDALFVGCGDLAVSLGEATADAPRVRAAVKHVASLGRRVFAAAPSMTDWLLDAGVRTLVVSSDQGLLRSAATDVHRQFAEVRA